jgi:S1-C subfamily serine protease
VFPSNRLSQSVSKLLLVGALLLAACDLMPATVSQSPPFSASPSHTPTASPVKLSRADIAALGKHGTVRVDQGNLQGSGVYLGGGRVLTAAHVVPSSAAKTMISLDERTVGEAQLIRVDRPRDLALLTITGSEYGGAIALRLGDSTALREGDDIVAVGYPEGLPLSVKFGIVSGIRHDAFGDLIQTDASLNHGMSGGPLLDERGGVVGITDFGLDSSTGLNFAIASSTLQQFMDNSLSPVVAATPSPTPALTNPAQQTARPATPPARTASPSTPAPTSATTNFPIAGTVISASTGLPMRGVPIRVEAATSTICSSCPLSALTDASGHYLIYLPVPGGFRVYFSPSSGYVDQVWRNLPSYASPTVVNVLPGGVSGIDATLAPIASAGSVPISGRVTDVMTGLGVRLAIRLWVLENACPACGNWIGDENAAGFSDASGNYTVYVKPGTYRISFDEAHYVKGTQVRDYGTYNWNPSNPDSNQWADLVVGTAPITGINAIMWPCAVRRGPGCR